MKLLLVGKVFVRKILAEDVLGVVMIVMDVVMVVVGEKVVVMEVVDEGY